MNYHKYNNVPKEVMVKLYERMLYIRLVSEAIQQSSFRLELKCPIHFSIGQEATAAGMGLNLRQSDLITTTHRSHAPYLAKGGDLSEMIAEIYNKRAGSVRGIGGSMHLSSPDKNVFCSSIVGGGIPIAVGAALGFKMQNKKAVAVAFFGDGAVEEGVFHESLNFASLKKLPAIFYCENNLFAVHSSIYNTQANYNIYQLAKNYHLLGLQIDGNNILEVYQTAKRAVQLARTGKGPVLIEAKTYRWCEHVGPHIDDKSPYRSKKELAKWIKRCPLKNYENYLLKRKFLNINEIIRVKKTINNQIKKAWEKMKKSPPLKLKELSKFEL